MRSTWPTTSLDGGGALALALPLALALGEGTGPAVPGATTPCCRPGRTAPEPSKPTAHTAAATPRTAARRLRRRPAPRRRTVSYGNGSATGACAYSSLSAEEILSSCSERA
ncbi:hypothetical protein [Kitasatospora sp. NPDC050463]|uniref:hypothetical protein n=1 Tax=Kitasatospora sp. NPDC050463 TaxID=3155786 RepID=UPI0033D66DF3